MKKLSLLPAVMLLAVTLLTLLPITAFAEGETEATPTPTPTATEEAPETTSTPTSTQDDTQDDSQQEPVPPGISLSIDNDNIYNGMDKAYKDGYMPAVKNGVATVILPLVASGEIKDNTITVTPGLGDTMSSPFVYKNYQKAVTMQENVVNGGASTVLSYLVCFNFTLASDRVNGVYPITIDVQAQDANGNAVTKSFTSYVTITDGKDPNAQPTPEPTKKPESQPKIIVNGYSISPSPVEAGSDFTATVTLKNTNERKSVKNMTVTISCDCPNFSLLNESNVFYIDKIKKGETTDVEIKYATDLNTPAQTYNITLTMEYDNYDAMTLCSTGTVPVVVTQPLRVEMTAPTIEDQVNAGDTMPLSFHVMNLGRSAVYNVRVELSAPGLIPSSAAFIGNMEAGTSMQADMDVFVGTKNMSEGYEGDEKYGFTNGTITLIYEDAEGQEYTQETEFSTMISEPVITVSNNNEEEKEQEKASQWWISIVIGILIVGGLAAYIIIRNKRKGKDNANF